MENKKFIFEKGKSTPIETDVKPGEQIPNADVYAALAKLHGLSPEDVETMFTTGKVIVQDDGAEQSS